MSCQLNGKEIEQIFFPNGCSLKYEAKKMFFRHEYLGDHAENWVVVMDGGEEIERHNVVYLSCIKWKENDQ